MAKFQNRMLQSCTGSYLACSPSGYGDQLMKCSHHLKLRKSWCTIGTSHLKVGRNCEWSPRFGSGFRLGIGVFSFSSVHVNVYNCGSLVNAIRYCSLPNYGAFSRRFCSRPARVVSEKGSVGFDVGTSSDKYSLSTAYDKLWSQAKAMATQNRKIAVNTRPSATKGHDTVPSGDQVVKGRKKKAVSGNNEESKAKQTIKKVASGSKVALQAKRSKATNTGKTKEASKQTSKKVASGSEVALQAKKSKATNTCKTQEASKQTSKKVASGSKVALQVNNSKATNAGQTKEASKQTIKSVTSGSKVVLQANKSNTTNTDKAKKASKNASIKVPNGSAALKLKSNSKNKKSSGKVKSFEESNGSLRKQKPQGKEKTISSRTARSINSKKFKSVKEGDKSLDELKPGATEKTKPWTQKALKPLYPLSGKSVVVVESLTKAKVIQGYLGDGFEVLASHGHVRDLASRTGSVRTNDNFSMVWEVPTGALTHLKSIEAALGRAENLILASDPDREGEAIAWHIFEILQLRDALREDVTVSRVVFHEITEASIKRALQAPRIIDENLVHAYLARRALDYLIGFNISPLLWKKLPGCRSAGRVQSAALSLICDREMEIDVFKPKEYWTVEVEFKPKGPGSSILSRLTHFDSEKLSQFSICSRAEAVKVEHQINSTNFRVVNSKKSQMRKHPPAPFITSTLQQEAANKLHFSATHTMKLAQKLYEGVQLSDGKAAGLITYIRTDGLHISDEAVKDIRSLVTERYGSDFAAEGARKYFKKVKNAQEAHEAIRPTDIRRLPSMLTGIIDEDSLRLYTLVWARTLACQMEAVVFDQIQLDIGSTADSITFRSSCLKLGFPGYQAVYKDMEAETIRYKENEENDRVESFEILNSLKPEDPLYISKVELKEHKTQPPPRYSESSLVKKLEELGIGRPSTYASTLKVLQDRKYVTIKSRVLYPAFRGRMVSAFLSHLFLEVSDYSFTADMEAELDNVSAGLTEWRSLLGKYWTRFSSYCSHANDVPIHQVEKMLEKKFSEVIFTSLGRECPRCAEGTLIFKVSKHGDGFFIGCDQHPLCRYTANKDEGTNEVVAIDEPKLLGSKPNSDEKVFLKRGPYGLYVQLGENRKRFTPQRASVPQNKDVNELTLEDALTLLSYPKTLGSHPIDGQPVVIKISNNGFSLKHGRTYVEISEDLNLDEITMEKAVELLASREAKRVGRRKQTNKVKVTVEVV